MDTFRNSGNISLGATVSPCLVVGVIVPVHFIGGQNNAGRGTKDFMPVVIHVGVREGRAVDYLVAALTGIPPRGQYRYTSRYLHRQYDR